MKKPILKFRLEKWDKCIPFQVIEQNYRKINRGSFYLRTDYLTFRTDYGIYTPMFSHGQIFLRGYTKELHYGIEGIRCDTKKEVNEYYGLILNSFKELSKHFGRELKQEGSIFWF